MPNRNMLKPLIPVLLLALALRLLLWSQPLHQLANDEVEYVTVARDLLAGRGWSFYDHYHWLRAPLYPLFLAGSLWLTGGDLHLAALPNLALSVANVALVALLTRLLAGRRAAVLAAAIMAVLWTNVTFASLYMLETLFTFLFSGGLLALVAGRLKLWRAMLSGLLFGLAALTRSAVLPFVAGSFVLLLWQAYQQKIKLQERSGLLPVLAWIISIALVIAPWTLRNTIAYGQPILIETGLSYNLWAFNEPRQSLDQIQATLEKIANPAERSDYASAQGMQRLGEDATILLRKLWPNWVFLARVKPIQDRFLQESYYSSIDLPLFSAALIFDDLLYVLIVLAALYGIRSWQPRQLVSSPSSLSILTVLWIVVMLVTILLTHGEARYRHFFLPVLIPYAARALLDPRSYLKRGQQHSTAHSSTVNSGDSGVPRPQTKSVASSRLGALVLFRQALRWDALEGPHAMAPSPTARREPLRGFWRSPAITIALSVIFLWTILTSYPYAWASENLSRGWYTALGDIVRTLGQPDAAIQAYRQASAAQRAADPHIRLGDTARAQGNMTLARDAYQAAQRISPLYEASAAKLGDLLRAQGDLAAARAAFNGDYLNQQRMTDWSWRELQPEPRSIIDIGDGLDYGFLGGFYPAEEQQGTTLRWTGVRAFLRLNTPDATQLSMRLAAARPDHTSVPMAVCIETRCTNIIIASEWRTIHIVLPAHSRATTIELRSATFRSIDGRELGVMVDWASLHK